MRGELILERFVVEHRFDSLFEGVVIAGFDNVGSFLLAQELAGADFVCGERGGSAGHGFQKYDPESLRVGSGWEYEQVAGLIVLGEFFVGDVSQELYIFELLGFAHKVLFSIPIANDGVVVVGSELSAAQEYVDSFVAMVGVQPSNKEDARFAVEEFFEWF